MPSLLIYGKGGESESSMVSKENIIVKVSNNIKKEEDRRARQRKRTRNPPKVETKGRGNKKYPITRRTWRQ